MNDNYEHEQLPYRTILIKLIIIVTIVLVLIWLYYSLSPKYSNDNSFTDNLNKFKNSALKYYTNDNLNTKKIKLGKLIELRKINDLRDSNNKICNSNKSYFKLTKVEDNYNLKVSLTCSEETDYINVLVGSFDYCKNTYLCEKKEEKLDKKSEQKMNNTGIDNDVVNSDEEDYNDEDDVGVRTFENNNNNNNNFIDFSTVNKKSNYVKRKTNPKSVIEVVDTTNDSRLYEYRKDNYYWSSWDNLGSINCDYQSKICSDSFCDIEEKVMEQNSQKIITKNYQISDRDLVKIETSYIKSCHNYVIIDSNTYELVGNNYDTNAFISAGVISSSAKLVDTISTHYDLVDIDINGENIKYNYNKSFYPGNYKLVNGMDNNCPTIKKLIRYKTEDKIYNFNKNVYQKECYKMRRYKIKGSSDIKWSNYNDLRLLEDGYYYTGINK